MCVFVCVCDGMRIEMDIGLQMAFWQNRSVSLVDMYIDNSEPTENVGQIHFSIEYDFENTTLILKIIQVPTDHLKYAN